MEAKENPPDSVDSGIRIGVPALTAANVQVLLRVVLELVHAQQAATEKVQDLVATLPKDLPSDQVASIAFVSTSLDKIDDALASALAELELLRDHPAR